MDLRPSFTTNGIQFSFTDTTIEEDTFEIVRANSVSTIDDGEIVVNVPYALKGCGRQFSSIQFTDLAAAATPGMVYVYGVRARKESTNYASTQAINRYTVPWFAEIFINVQTDGGAAVGVEGVPISVCAFDGVVTTGRCWDAETDVFGVAKVEILVADEEWTDTMQYFQITPVPQPLQSHCLIYGEAEGQDSAHLTGYNPVVQTIGVRHMESQTIRWVDSTL
jgi:hypothetical protein